MNIVDLNDDGIAMDGFDPVSYWNNQPQRGTAEYTFLLDDITYWFASAENLEKFQENPEKYIPRYGGYCAVGMSENRQRKADPNSYAIHDEKLYLFSRSDLDDARVSWETNVPAYLNTAETNWRTLNLSDSNN